MPIAIRKIWQSTFCFILALNANCAFAAQINWVFPGGPSIPTAPLILDMNPGQSGPSTLTVNSGTFQTTNSTAYTVLLANGWEYSSTVITIASGATVSYNGSNVAATTIVSTANQERSSPMTFNISGVLSKGTGASAFIGSNVDVIFNLTGATSGNGLITGDLTFGGTLNIDGAFAAINGNISYVSVLNLGSSSAVAFTTQGSISGLTEISLVQGNFTVNNDITGLSTSVSLANNTTMNLNAAMTGTGTTSNVGTMNINNGATYNLTGAFTNNSGNKAINVRGTFTVPSSFTNTGTIEVDGTVATINGNTLTGSVGSILNIGRTDSATNFTTSVATSGIPTIRLYQGTYNINHAISGVTSLTFDADSFANVAATITGTGTFFNASTLTLTSSFSAAQFGTASSNQGIIDVNNVTLTAGGPGSVFVNTGEIYLYGASANLTGIWLNAGNTGSLHIGANSSGTTFPTTNYSSQGLRMRDIEVHAGNFSPQIGLIGINGTFLIDSGATVTMQCGISLSSGTVINNGTLTLPSGFTFTLPITNGSSGNTGAILNVDTGLQGAVTNSSGNTINITGATSSTSTFANSGTMVVNAAFTATSNTVGSEGTLEFATGAANSAPTTIQQGGALSVTGTNVTNASAIGVSGTMTIAGTYSGAGVNTINSGGSATFSSGSNASPFTIASGANLSVTGTFTNTATITNQGTTTISAALNGAAGTINNTATNSVLTLANGSSVANTITSSKIINVTGSTTITDHDLTSSGTLNMSGDMNMAGLTLTNSGRVNLSGNRSLTANNYINSGSISITLYNESTYDSLSTNGTMDFTGGTVLLTESFNGTPNVVNSWTILSADGGISGLTQSQINVPSSSFFEIWQVSINPNTVVIQAQFNEATAGINARIAQVLNQMSQNITNAGQQELINEFGGFGGDFNKNLHQMIPINGALQVNYDLQNSVFKKAETRIAALRNGSPMAMSSGINVGDMAPDCDMWLSTFGAWTNQKANEDSDGFNAKTGAAFLGMDNRINDDYLGAALGYSNTHTSEYTSADFITHTDRYHAMVYGTHNMKRGNYVDFLATGNYYISTTSRYIIVNNNNLSTEGRFTGYQMAAKIIRGKAIDFWDSYRLTPLTYAQYVYVNQNPYKETGSVAALNVQNRSNNIVTLGAGSKFSFPLDAWESFGLYELRAIGSYDVVSPHNITTVNFVVGSNSFQVISAPARWALQLGAGVTYELSEKGLLDLNYDYEMRSGFSNNTVMAKFRYLF